MIKKCTFFLITMLLVSSTLIHGKETLLMSERDFKTLIPDMTVSINRILDDGTLLCIGEPGKGEKPECLHHRSPVQKDHEKNGSAFNIDRLYGI